MLVAVRQSQGDYTLNDFWFLIEHAKTRDSGESREEVSPNTECYANGFIRLLDVIRIDSLIPLNLLLTSSSLNANAGPTATNETYHNRARKFQTRQIHLRPKFKTQRLDHAYFIRHIAPKSCRC